MIIVKSKTKLSVSSNFSKISILLNWKSFLFKVKSLGYTPKHLQKHWCLDKFKKAIIKCKNYNCPYRIYKKYIANDSFIKKTMLELFIN